MVRTPGSDSVYLCGNSLGLQPVDTRSYVLEELDKWAEHGVEGHFRTVSWDCILPISPISLKAPCFQERPWVSIEDTVVDESAKLVGGLVTEVVVMNSLTVNLHLLMAPFYRHVSFSLLS